MEGVLAERATDFRNALLVNGGGLPSSLHGDQATLRRATVSVIIPTLNEARNLPEILPFLPLDWIDEVILVDGRSTDGTVEIAREILPSAKVILEKRPGKGAAMRAGYQEAAGDIVVVIDADGSNDPREIPRYITPLLEGADMVKGSRFSPGGGTTDMSVVRKAGNAGLVLLSNFLFGTKFTDLCYGFHAFWKHCLASLDIAAIDGFEIDAALYLQAVRNKLKVVEVASFEGYRFHGVGKLQTIPDGWRVLKAILREFAHNLRKTERALPIGFRGLQLVRGVDAGRTSLVPAGHAIKNLGIQLIEMVSLLLALGINFQGLWRRLLGLMLQVFEASRGSIFLFGEDGQVQEAWLGKGNDVWKSRPADGPLPAHPAIADLVLQNHQAMVVPDLCADPLWVNSGWEGDCPGSFSALIVPLVLEEKAFGVLTLIRSSMKRFSETDLLALKGMMAAV